MKQTLQIAVRTLVEHVLRSGDLELTFIGTSRAVDGIRAHQAIQKSRPDTYTSEVTISHEIDSERFTLIVSGRIDGVHREGDHTIIDEIKSTRLELEKLDSEKDPLHWGQAKCYAYLYALSHNLPSIDVQLTYYRLDTGEIKEIRESYPIEALELFFQGLIDKYLKWAEILIDWYGVRNSSLQRLEFPFSTYRPGQREMAVDAYRTIKQGNQILIQAATGIGKTMAVIFPALKALGEELTPKIFYLTARTTGKRIAENTLRELRISGAEIKSLTITAKDKICFHPESECTADACEYAKGHFDRINHAMAEIFERHAWDRETIIETGGKHRVCPFEFSLELSLWADCVICDYNYAFDPRVYLRRFFMEENNGFVFLIDEAHNLVDRAREMFSSEIHKQPFLDLRRAVKNDLPVIYKRMGRINAWLVKRRKQCDAAGGMFADKEPPESLFPLLRRFLKSTERWLSLNIKAPYRKALLDLYFSVNGFVKISEQYDESYATCTEKLGTDLKLKLFCVDPSVPLGHAQNRCSAAIFFSATLTPLDYFKEVFGCDPSAERRVYPSPFPQENLCVLLSDRISTRYRHRGQTTESVADALVHFVEQKKGNYLLFFPSYAYMKTIYAAFDTSRPHVKTLTQSPDMREDEREEFLETFSTESQDTLVGFVVMGGIFGEGIDLTGEKLSGAAIVGPGLPGISLERNLIRDYFDHHLHLGFEYAFLYPGMIRVLQAAGRVIRSENDRGTVLLIGQRFAASPYRELLPSEWQSVSVREKNDFEEILRKFW